MLKSILELALTASTFAATFRLACPILFGAMGGCFNHTSGCVNIAYEAVSYTHLDVYKRQPSSRPITVPQASTRTCSPAFSISATM